MKNKIQRRGSYVVIFIPRKLGRALRCLVDADDLPKIMALGRSVSAGWNSSSKTFYCYCAQGGGLYPRYNVWLSRLVTDAPPGLDVDHGNHNGLDNRKLNLKVCTRSVNLLNRKGPEIRNVTSGVQGVRRSGGKGFWQAYVKYQGKFKHLGRFSSRHKAASIASNYRKSLELLS